MKQPGGVIYTFYSYKGGVGRSMALANIGVHFQRLGYKTLLIDMDLEAPGLERYFEGVASYDTRGITSRGGFCDFVKEYLRRASAPPSDEEEAPYPSIDDYIMKIGGDEANPLMLMHAGLRAGSAWAAYARFVQTFDWTGFYDRWEGGACLDWFANELRQRADVILVDSRTGVTEMGGVATQHLADSVVILFGSNVQNVENSARMAAGFVSDSVRESRGGRPLGIMAVPSRVDDQDSKGFVEFQQRYQEAFANVTKSFPAEGHGMEDLRIPYLAACSYRESIVFGDAAAETSAQRIVTAYTKIASNLQLMAPKETPLREGKPSGLRPGINVVLLAGAHDEALAQDLSERLRKEGITAEIIGPRIALEKDLAGLFSKAQCILPLVTPALKDSFVLRSLLPVVLDLQKPVIPALFGEATLPLLLSDRRALSCRAGLDDAAERLVNAVRAAGKPAKAQSLVQAGRGRIRFCYAESDIEAAHEYSTHLLGQGFSVWRYSDIAPGASLQSEIAKAIEDADAVVALISPASARSSVVQAEWAFAHRLNKVFIPVLITDTDIPMLLRRPIIDARYDRAAAKGQLQWTLENALAPEHSRLATLEGHAFPVQGVAVTADGRCAVSSSFDKTLKVWDLQSGRELRHLAGHLSYVNAVAITPDGRQVVSGSFDKTLKVWDLESGQELRQLVGHTDSVQTVAVTPDGKRVVSGSRDHTLRVWDLASGQELRGLVAHKGPVFAVVITPDGTRVVSASADETMKVWDLESGHELQKLKGHMGPVFAVAVTPDGRCAVSGSRDHTLKVWDLESGNEVRQMVGHGSSVQTVAVTPDGKYAVSGSLDNMLKVWDLESGNEVRQMVGHGSSVTAVAVTPDGKRVVSGSADKTLKVWDLESGRLQP